MNAILYLSLDGFYADVLARQLEHAGRAVVVLHEKRVLDACPQARAAVALPGRTEGDARALCPYAAFVRFESEPYREAQEAWLDVLCTASDAVEPDGMHAAWVDLGGHPDPIAVAEEVLAKLNRPAFAGLAPAKWMAKAQAGLASADEPAVVRGLRFQEALREPAAHVAPWPVDLLPVDRAIADRLCFLGYATLGQVATVPLNVLQRQFGPESLTIAQAARGAGMQPVRPVFPRDALAERMRFEAPLQDREAVERVLKRLSERLGLRLTQRDWAGKSLEVTVRFEDAEPKHLERTFNRTLHSPGSVFGCLTLLLADQLDAPVEEIRVRLPRLAPRREVQAQLGADPEAARRDAEGALDRVRGTFGDRSVALAGHLEAPRRKQVLRAWSTATGWV